MYGSSQVMSGTGRATIILAAAAILVAACAGSDSGSVDRDTAPTGTTSPTTETSEGVTTAVATTTTMQPECQSSAVRFVDNGRERCVEGQWEAFPITTAEPPPSTERPPTTQRATTTTIDPGDEADLQAVFLLGGIESGEAADVIQGFIDVIEPFPLDRVDVVTADIAAMNIVLVATSGYSTVEYQQEAAVDTVARLAELWGVPALAGLGTVKVGLDLTVDGRRYVVTNDSMRAVLNRRMTPQAALGI